MKLVCCEVSLMVRRIMTLFLDAVRRRKILSIFQRFCITGDVTWILQQQILRASCMLLRQVEKLFRSITTELVCLRRWSMVSSMVCIRLCMSGRSSLLSLLLFLQRIILMICRNVLTLLRRSLHTGILSLLLLRTTVLSRRPLIITRLLKVVIMFRCFITRAISISRRLIISVLSMRRVIISCFLITIQRLSILIA